MKLNHRMLLFAVCSASLFVIMLVASTARAQQAAGSITGFVTDASGSAVQNAAVTAQDVDRGTTWTTKTTDAGLYEFPTIPVGKIKLTVEAQGFSVEVRPPFTLVLNQVARVDFHLKVGMATETVTVSDAPPLLQTGSTEIGTLIDANAASTLPLATRDINQLTLLAPGVLTSNIFAFQSPQTTFGTGRPYVNGAREQDNNFILDGMDINQPDNDDVAYTPAPDAVQEFNMVVSNAPADYGNYAGGVIVESVKSGTNQFHGNLYEFVRNTDLDANTWQNKANAFITGAGPAKTLPRPAVQWNEFGGTVGGPILHNKLFFFADMETSLYNQPKTPQTNTVVPSSSFYTATTGKSGSQVYDLGSFCTSNAGASFNASGQCVGGTQLYMPAAGTVPGARAIIPYNQIPVSVVSPVAKALVGMPAFQNEVSTLNYFQSGYTHNYQGDLKIDWQPSQKDHVMGRYTQMFTHVIQSNGTDLLTPNLERQYPLKNIVADYVHTFTPTLLNDFRLGTQIFPANDQIYTSAASGNINTQINLPNVPVDVLPQMNIGYGPSNGYVGGSDGPEVFHDTTDQIEDSLTWTHGRHSIHTGFEWLHYAMNDTYAGNNGEAGVWTFNGQYTNNTGGSGSGGSGYADFLLGLPASVGVGQPIHFHLVNSLGAAYIQDNYQLKPNFTLNLGLHFEVVTPRGDRNQQNNINFDLVSGTPEVGTNYNTYKGIGDYQPRVGFAWQPSFAPGTVLRGAYDISSFMEGNGISNMAVINPPNSILINQNNTSGANLNYPQYTLTNGYAPYQSTCTAAQLQAFSASCLSGAVTHATDPNLRPAMNQQWNLTVQHQFKNNFTASIGYVGDKDDHMSDIFWYNQKVLTSATQQVKDITGSLVTVPAVAAGPFMQKLVTAGVGQARFNASNAISRFNAMELTVSQKAYHGLDLQANYTWSKCLSNSLGYFGAYGDEEGSGEQQNEGGQNFFQNEYNPKGDYGKCTIDAASAFNAYALYNLPFGRGKLFGANVSSGVNEIIGGWNVSLDTTFRSGFAVTPYDGSYMGSANPASASALTAPSYVPRASCVAGQSFGQSPRTVQSGSTIGVRNLNPAAVTYQADGQFGNCGVGVLRGPHLKTADLNLNKAFPITEHTDLKFMAQFVNLTNTPIFSIPNSWWDQYSSEGTGLYGVLDGSNPGRQIELSLKLDF